MATNSERIADLERQLAQLRRDFEANWTVAKFLHDVGYEMGRASILGQRQPEPATRPARGSHLYSVGGAR